MMALVKHGVNTHANTQTDTYLNHLFSKGSFCMKTEDVAELAWGLVMCVCVCVCESVYTLAHGNAVSVVDVYMKLIIEHVSRRFVAVLSTTRKAAEIWRPAEPGPSQQNPRIEHHNHIHQTPGGLQRGPSQEPTPEEAVWKPRDNLWACTTQKASRCWLLVITLEIFNNTVMLALLKGTEINTTQIF